MADKKIQFEVAVDAATGIAKIKQVGRASDELTTSMKRQEAAAKGLSESWRTLMGAAVASFGISQLKGFLVESAKLAGAQQEAVAGMEQALKSMGRYTPQLSASLQQLASSLQDVTLFEDDAIIQGQKFLATYKDITDDLLPRTSKTMLDLAALMGGDTTQAANMLGKASMGMTGELRRVGITVDETTFKAKGFVGVLAEIEKQVGGQAEALASTGIGPWKQLANIWGDSKEAIGELALALSSSLLPTLRSLAAVVREAAEHWKIMFTAPDAKGALEQQRVRIAEQITAEERLLNYLKNTTAGRISAGPDGVAQVEARIAALKAGMQTVSKSLITATTEKPAGAMAPGAGGAVAGDATQLKKQMEKIADEVHKAYNERMALLGRQNKSALAILGMEQDADVAAGKEAEAIADEVHRAYQAHIDQLGKENASALRIFETQQDAYFKDLGDEAEKGGKLLVDLSQRTAEAMEQNFSDLFFDAMKGQFKDLGDYAEALLGSIQRAIADYAGQMAKIGLFGTGEKGSTGLVQTLAKGAASVVGSLFGGGGGDYAATGTGSAANYDPYVYHQGGVVGRGGRRRSMPASLFVHAPRLHGGLAADEYPAILQRGETVLPRNAAPVTNVTVINRSGGEARTSESRNQSGGKDIVVEIERMIAGNVSSGRGPLYGSMRKTFGAAPVVGGR